jgi:hypothetical protein
MASNSAKPAAGGGGFRQCIGSGQNLTADSTEHQTSTQAATTLPLDQITVGERHRKDLVGRMEVDRPCGCAATGARTNVAQRSDSAASATRAD